MQARRGRGRPYGVAYAGAPVAVPGPDIEGIYLTSLAIDQCIQRLDPREALTIRWYYWWGYSTTEIGARLSVSQVRASQIRLQAEQHLRAWLAEESSQMGQTQERKSCIPTRARCP
mgnify:CR=1 FL=1